MYIFFFTEQYYKTPKYPLLGDLIIFAVGHLAFQLRCFWKWTGFFIPYGTLIVMMFIYSCAFAGKWSCLELVPVFVCRIFMTNISKPIFMYTICLSLFASFVVQDGQTYCRRRPCDCGDQKEDLFCCPGCDNRPSSHCLDQSGRTLYHSGASWMYGCQQCRCMVRTLKIKAIWREAILWILSTELNMNILNLVKTC